MKIRKTNSLWEAVRWPVIARSSSKGWRTGHTLHFTLECGHQYAVPASRRIGEEHDCIFCAGIWRWYTVENAGLVDVGYALEGIKPNALRWLNFEAKRQGRLVRGAA